MFNRIYGSTGFVLAILLVLATAGESTVIAQTPTPSPSAEELRLLEEKRLLELQRDIEQAKKAIRDAQEKAPTPTATPLAGDTIVDGDARLETDIVAYKAMAEAAKKIVEDIDARLTNDPSSLAIYDAQIVRDWRFYQAVFPAFKGQTEDILSSYKDLICSPGSGVDTSFYNKYCKKSSGDVFAAGETVRTQAFTPAAIQSAFAVGGNLIKSFIDLAALFRTDTKITGKSLTIDESALVAEVFRVFKNNDPDIQLYYPEIFPPRVDPNGQSETIQLVGLLFLFKTQAERLIKTQKMAQEAAVDGIKSEIREKGQIEPELAQVKQLKQELNNLHAALGAEKSRPFRQKLWQEIAEVQTKLSKLRSQAELEARLAYLKSVINPVMANNEAKEAIIKPLIELNVRFQKFVDEFVKVDGSGMNALALFIKSEDIAKALAGDNSYWLEIKSVAAGGNNRTRKNLIWFFAGARLDHSGGVVIEYTVYNKQGAVVVSDKLAHYEGYVKPKKIRSNSFKDPQ